MTATLHPGGSQTSVSSTSAGGAPEPVAAAGALSVGTALAATGAVLLRLGISTSCARYSRRTLCPDAVRIELPSGPAPTFSFTPLRPRTWPGMIEVGPLYSAPSLSPYRAGAETLLRPPDTERG